MLNGTELGAAIKAAIDLKIASGAVASQAAIARHFNVKPPSIHDWIKKGSISKDKLPELWRYFSDVVGPDHWGLRSWPDMGTAAPSSGDQASPPWPFQRILEDDVRALAPSQLSALEGAMALVIAQMKMPVKVISPRQAAAGLVDIDAATDEFPMTLSSQPGPQEVEAVKAPRKAARVVSGAVDNIRPAAPYPANDEMVDVPELGDVRLAANIEGHENETEHQTGVMQFRKSFLQSVGADGGRGRVVYAKGDSMEPIIGDGSALLVVLDEHLTVRDLAVGGIYAIRYDGKTMVKKVVKDKLTGHWVARSFNETYGDVSLENGVPVRVLGRVVWAGTKLA